MLGYVLVGLLIFAIIYVYSRDDRQFLSTASAIQQIWSGSCRLRCRDSKKIVPESKNDENTGSDQNIASSSRYPEPSNCVCESCPCALVENFIETCSPAARTYAFITSVIFQAYYDFIELCIDLFERAMLVLQTQENGTSQHIGQAEPNKVKIKKIALAKVNFSGRKDDDKGAGTEAGTSGARDATDAKTDESDQRNEELSGTDCPSCAEKGLTCIGKCPAERPKKD